MNSITARIAAALCFLLIGGGVIAGCGGSSDSDSTTKNEAPSDTTTGEEATSTDPLADLRSTLESDGYVVKSQQSSDADAAILVDDMVSVAYYEDEAKAKSVGKDISGVYETVPGHGIVLSQGHLVVDLGKERTLKPSELAKFNLVAAAALKSQE